MHIFFLFVRRALCVCLAACLPGQLNPKGTRTAQYAVLTCLCACDSVSLCVYGRARAMCVCCVGL